MAKYGFNKGELRKVITTSVDKDGFQKREAVDVLASADITLERLETKKLEGTPAKYLIEYGLSRPLNEDETVAFYDFYTTDLLCYGRYLEYMPDISPIESEIEIVLSKTPLSRDWSPFPMHLSFVRSQRWDPGYIFIYKKDTQKIVGTNYNANEYMKLKLRSASINLTPAPYGDISATVTAPLLANERFVIVPTDEKYLNPRLWKGKNLPEKYIEFTDVFDLSVDRTVMNERTIEYKYDLKKDPGLENSQKVWVAIADDDNTVVDYDKTSIRRT